MKMPVKSVFAVILMLGMWAVPASAQDNDMQALMDRLERMDRDIKALNLKVYRGEGAPAAVTSGGEQISGPLGARLSIRINELESQMRQMTGQIEETAYRISQITTRLDKLVADVDFRLSALEQGSGATLPPTDNAARMQEGNAQGTDLPNGVSGEQLAAPGQESLEAKPGEQATASKPGVLGTLEEKDLTNPGLTTKTPDSNTPSQSTEPNVDMAGLKPQAQYEKSRQMLMRGEFGAAEKAFKNFLEENRDHKLTGNVRYWLGETYYVQSNFAQAAATFLEGYQKAPRGAKAPDSLLKLGMSLKRMDKQREACATFDKLRADFPKMPAHLSKTLERERSGAKCN